MAPQNRTVEQVLALIAGRSHGVATRREVLRAGVTDDEIRHRLRTGALIRVYRGVYRVGHAAPSTEAGYLAAVRASGPGALLSGRAAGFLLGVVKGSPPPPEVTAPTERRLPGVKVRRSRQMGSRDGATWRRIPVTSVARTLVDLAAELDTDALARACHEAGVRHRTTPRDVEAVLQGRPSSPGAGTLRRILHGDVPVTLSRLEARFLGRLHEARLPLPRTNRPAGGRRVDCRWPDRRLTIELDGYRYHSSRHAWEQDRHREREARARGDEFRRYTYGDVFDQPTFMMSELRSLLP